MIKNWLIFSLFPVLLSCSQTEKTVDFAGVWVEKSLVNGKDTTQELGAPKFAVLFFDKNDTDSVKVIYANGTANKYFSQFAYNSHFIHFDKKNEYFFIPDYSKGELVFSNLRDGETYRFVKVDSLLPEYIPQDTTVNIDAFIQTVM